MKHRHVEHFLAFAIPAFQSSDIILPSGEQPSKGHGQVKLSLTEASGDVLAKVVDLKRWQVAPTMTRGSGGGSKTFGPVQAKPKAKKPEPKAKSVPQKTEAAKGVTQTIKKTRREKARVAKLETSEVGMDDIRRTIDGRRAVQRLMEDLMRLDQQIFPQAPAFEAGPEGACRLSFDGARKFTKQIVVDASGKAFECMYLACFRMPKKCQRIVTEHLHTFGTFCSL